MKNYIYQIGRLDPNMGLKDFRFQKDENNKVKIESYLSSFALKEYLEKEKNTGNIQTVLAYPVSAFFNTSLLKSEDLGDEFKKIIQEVIENEKTKEEYLKNPYAFYKKHTHIKDKNKEDVDYFVLHSIGAYNVGFFKNIYFESRFEDIVFEILIDMIKRITPVEHLANNEKTESSQDVNLYVDVSSGHNIYVSALLEAVKIFQHYFYLLNIFQKKKLYVKLVICDPILSHKGPYDMHIDYELKADFVLKSNLTLREINDNIVAKRVFHELEGLSTNDFRNKKNKLSEVLFSYGYIFSALKNGIPLALYQIKFCDISFAKESLKEILEHCIHQLSKSYLVGPNLNYDDILKSLYSIAFTISYLKISEEKGIKYKEYAYLDEIKKNFYEDESSLLNILGYSVAKQLIANELKGYELQNRGFDNKRLIDRIGNQWMKLGQAMPYFEGGINQGINPRHFLAHAGFERTIVLVRKEDDRVLLKYDNEALKGVKNILLQNL